MFGLHLSLLDVLLLPEERIGGPYVRDSLVTVHALTCTASHLAQSVSATSQAMEVVLAQRLLDSFALVKDPSLGGVP